MSTEKVKPTDPVAAAKGDLQGEGNYEAAREYQKDQREFAKDQGRVDRKAREAEEALDAPEAEELEKARKTTAAGKTS